jgi:aspartate kinase
MKEILKFGGASIKNAESIKAVSKIIKDYTNHDVVIVFSAIASVTNLLEGLVEAYHRKDNDVLMKFNDIKYFHISLVKDLFDSEHNIFDIINNLFVEIEWALEEEPNQIFSYDYDQIVSIGELLSSNIMSEYLKEVSFKNEFLDVRDVFKSDNNYQNANIDWELTEEICKEKIKNIPIVTQGFLACSSENFTTTLGREGSDYSAAILAYVLDAERVVIWKDVDGVLTSDPRHFNDSKLLDKLSFSEAVELAYYGAKVIHPKTIQPLQIKNIPLQVRSFINLENQGTIITDCKISYNIPSYIMKENQMLVSISDKKLSFIVENHLSYIFSLLAENNLSVNLMQNSAVSFSICVDNHRYKIPLLIEEISKKFSVYYNTDLNLYTIRYYDDESISKVISGKKIFLEQKSRNTIQFITS